MARRAITAALVFFCGLTVPARAQDAVQLKWEFVKDKPIFQQITTDTKQTMKVLQMDISQKNNQTFLFSWTPKEQDKDKNWVILQKLEAVIMDIEIGGNPAKFDSTQPTAATNTPLAEFFKALVGSEFKLTITPDLKVTKIEGRDEFVSKLVKANPQMEPLLKQILGDDALKQMADPAFAAVPDKPVKKGDKWDKKSTLNMGPMGSFDTETSYTYEGKEGKLDKIKMDTKLTYKPPAAAASGNLPFKIKTANLTSENATGSLLFDNEKHRLESSNMKMTLKGTMEIDIGGTTTEVTVTQDQTTTVKVSETNPYAKK